MNLEVKNLNVGFNLDGEIKHILHDISITVHENTKVGIIGESGSGKTLTASSILGLLDDVPGVISGKIDLQNKPLLNTAGSDTDYWKQLYKRRTEAIRGHEVSIIFQDAKASLVPYQTIEEQAIETWKALNGEVTKSVIIDAACSLLSEMKLTDSNRVLKSYPNQLSGGECQRAYIMLALLGSPTLLIADEPTSSLDRINSNNLLRLIEGLCESKNMSLLLISHDLEDVVEYTDRVYVFFEGHVVEEFTIEYYESKVEEITTSHPYTQFLFSMADGRLVKELKVNPESVRIFDNDGYKETYTEANGCPYFRHCDLRKSLSSQKQKKCKLEKPFLEHYSQDNKSACWYDK